MKWVFSGSVSHLRTVMATSCDSIDSGSSEPESENFDHTSDGKKKVYGIKEFIAEFKKIGNELKHVSGKKLDYLKVLSEKNLNKWKFAKINIAIIGNSGVGKSTFINVYRGLKNDDEGAAAAGVDQTTKQSTPYHVKENPNLILWDLPGVGTTDNPKEGYLKKVEFEKFDVFILMTKNRFTENDAWLANQMRVMKKVFFFVRTHVWNDVENEKKANKNETEEEKVINFIRTKCKEYIPDIEDKIYLIDSLEPQNRLLDFERLKEDMAERLQKEKREALLHFIGSSSKKLITMHEKILRDGIKWRVVLAGFGGLIPLPGMSLFINSSVIAEMKNVFAQRLDLVISESFLSKLKQAGLSERGKDRVNSIISKCLDECEKESREKVSKIKYAIGIATTLVLVLPTLSSPAAAVGTYLAGHHLLDHMVKAAYEVNKAVLEDIANTFTK